MERDWGREGKRAEGNGKANWYSLFSTIHIPKPIPSIFFFQFKVIVSSLSHYTIIITYSSAKDPELFICIVHQSKHCH